MVLVVILCSLNTLHAADVTITVDAAFTNSHDSNDDVRDESDGMGHHTGRNKYEF